jgi:hypothetical protein
VSSITRPQVLEGMIIRNSCDALNHVLKEAFYQLPASEKAAHLLDQEKLDESQIKQLYKLRLELPEDEKSAALKEQIKQRLLAKR